MSEHAFTKMVRATLRTVAILAFWPVAIVFAGCTPSIGTAESPTPGATATLLPTATAVPVPTDVPTPIPTPVQIVPTASPAAYGAAAFDQFLEDAYAAQLRRDPELVTEYGLAGQLGMGNGDLTPVSDAYQLETYALLASQLVELDRFDRAALTEEQALSYDLFRWLLEDALAGKPYRFYNHPVKQVLGVHTQLLELMTDRHPMRSLRDAEDYISRLARFPEKVDKLLAWLSLQQAEGILMPQFAIRNVIWQLDQFVGLPPERTELMTSFQSKLADIEGLDPADRERLLQQAAEAVAQQAQPAYRELQDALRELVDEAPREGGLSTLPGGDAAYANALRHHTTTDLAADEIHALGLSEVARIQAELGQALDDLGIVGDDLRSRIGQTAMLAGAVRRGAVLDGYTGLIEEATSRLDPLFASTPLADVVVAESDLPGAAYYVPPSLDGSRPGTFYVGAGGDAWRFAMPTLAYHEAVPGHHTQLALAQELAALPTFRRTTVHTAYAEGWALYAELLAWEAGWYAEDPYGNIGRLQAELFRAGRLVVDTGIHAMGWTREEAIDYMMQEVGQPRDQAQLEVERYILWPGQATAYKVGMLELLALRERTEDRLGDDFELREFHSAVLLQGSLPLPILNQVVEATLHE